jgi:prophage antirepressor-like protein
MLDMTKMQLSLDGRVSKVMYFSEDDIWFEAKPLVLYLEYSPTHVTQTLGIVKDKNKKSLKELLDTRGQPKWVDLSDKSPGYHDLKALYVNEPGLYSLIFRSTKKQAQDFQDWVYEDVLTALRRHGSYKIGGDQAHALRTWLDGDLQIVLKKRDDELQPTPEKTEMVESPLPEPCLDWMKDLGVSRQELVGVKSQFKTLVQIEISAGQIPVKSPKDAWSKTPPLRYKDLAKGAVASYRSLLEQRCDAIRVGDVERTSAGKRKRSLDSDEDDDADEDDILKISEIMHAAGVWQAVWPSYRSDLANQMLSLKCAETGASFSARRPETVRGHLHVLVHKYKKSTDWPLAWTALQNTRDLYEKRVREVLNDLFRMAGRPTDESSLLARDVAARLRVSA